MLLLIVIVLLVRRNRNRNDAPSKLNEPRAKTKVKDRSVVAFENPMYDTAKAAVAESNTEGYGSIHANKIDDKHEGLYDEPAFKVKIDRVCAYLRFGLWIIIIACMM